MAGLLKNARNFWKGFAKSTPARAQRFSVTCAEGHVHEGFRTDGYQAISCPTCGVGMFLLPRSPLPDPRVFDGAKALGNVALPASTKTESEILDAYGEDDPQDSEVVAGPTGAGRDVRNAFDGDIEWIDGDAEGDAGPPQPSSRPQARAEDLAEEEMEAARGAATVASPRAPSQKTKSRPPQPTIDPSPAIPRESVLTRIKRHQNPLIFLGVGLLVVGTIAFRINRARRQELPRIAELGRLDGLNALDDGKFEKAYQILSEANRAVIELGDAYQGSAAIRQGAAEAEVFVRLTPSSLEEMLGEASQSDPKTWAERFKSEYEGRSVIVDAHLTATPDPRGEGRYEFDYRVLREGAEGNTPSFGRIDATDFKLLTLVRPKAGDRITFGAKLSSFRFDLDRDCWLIRFEPESGVLMTHTKALESIGWPAGDVGVTEEPL